MTETHYFGVEFGVQSFFDDDLLFYKRGHDSKTSIQSILKTSRETKVDIGIHLIFGSPYETNERIIETAQRCNDLPISSVKLHHLHVLKNTPLETLYIEKKFEPISFEKYAERVDLFLSHLSPRFYVHRLAAYSSRWNDLISPSWTSDKMKTHQGIIDFIRDKNNFQSKYYFATNESERELQNQLKIQSQKRD